MVYGLPLQTEESLSRTIHEVLTLVPDRIAFYSYAHVPWTSKGQRLFDETHLPNPDQKLKLHQVGKELFLNAGYDYIGMDHFALPGDDLAIAHKQGRLHRNFMGYTTQKTSMLIGLGVSSISDIGIAFAQNEKILERYYSRIFSDNELPIVKGYFLSEEDLKIKNYILDISCKGKTNFKQEDLPMLEKIVFPKLFEMQLDGLLNFDQEGLFVTDLGRQFTRNICSAFDLKLMLSKEEACQPVFSKAV
ncbi:MAG: hypothetical protein EAZ07_08855 [Cytophagales bacterium]|nr:MAG: hypothetical protein EAZ07_08855 [Cytophagales bacterium]